MKTIKGYKFLTSQNKSYNGDQKWKKGVWVNHKGELELCESGLHASRTPLQSLQYVYGDNWWIVGARGKFKEDKNDKFVCSEMRIIKRLPVKKILVKFAILCAKRCLKNYEKEYPNDNRPRKSIEAAERYYKNPSKKNKDVAEAAARSAARYAARSAELKWQKKTLNRLVKDIGGEAK